jgi:regulatory protein
LGLRLDQPLTPQRRAQLESAEQDSRTGRAALKLLEYRARSRAELARRLRRKNLPNDSVQRVLAELQASGLIDDEQFARQLARSLMNSKNLGTRAILSKLEEAGVARDLAQAVCEDELGEYDERSRAEAAAAEQLKRLTGLDPATRRRRLYGYLHRRGFGHALVAEITQRMLYEDESTAAEDP